MNNEPLQDQNLISEPIDPYSAKANFDVKEEMLHKYGFPSLWREVSNLLILVGIIAGVVLLFRLF
ncbi:hypothetical protein [Paenibacillus sp. Marseille-Q4541]|uniref:hypothetical protein n=1 Tax=Paenibacillus sp. Marseille-Q4541 TaxID=2831522 RepID=UPI001BA73CD3|nr:hypothetical protein [Paenibacillus sp. Marseille-Q4541]